MTPPSASPRYLQGVLRAALLVVVVLAAAGCGGDSEPSASENYANEVCSSFSTWLTDTQSTVQTVTDAGFGTTKDDLQSAVDDVGNSTDKLGSDLQAAGAPDSEDGQKAKSEVESLMSQLRDQLATIQGRARLERGHPVDRLDRLDVGLDSALRTSRRRTTTSRNSTRPGSCATRSRTPTTASRSRIQVDKIRS